MANGENMIKVKYKIDGKRVVPELSSKKGDKNGKSLKAKVLSRVFSEDYERVKKKILDPRGPTIRRWNKIFLVACLVSLFVDPLFFYLPVAKKTICIDIGLTLEVVLTIIRSIADIFYTIQIYIRFRTAYVAPSSRVFGRGELVIDSSKIASRYLRRYFWLDLLAALPLPQVRASWYLLAIERQEACWRHACNLESPSCLYKYFDCRRVVDSGRNAWFLSSNVTNWCNPDNSLYPFGIYGDAVTSEVTSAKFFNKYFYCLWWGLKNLSSLGQNLATSTYVGEISFAIIIATLGLVLFALLIGNMQTYLQSTTVRLEEWRIRRTDTEQWMHHRQLPQELRQSVEKYDQYKWLAARGVDEEALLKGLPLDLRRDIKRHLCYDLVRRVPLFDQMDERMLDAICERLKPALCTQSTCLVREGDPVNEMLFIIRGNLDSYTTNGGRTGFFNSCRIGPGEFCGEELLTWALDLVRASETPQQATEAQVQILLAPMAAWAACFIQAAWRRYKKRRSAAELRALESLVSESESSSGQGVENEVNSPGSGFAVYAARLAASRRGVHKHTDSGSSKMSALQKRPSRIFRRWMMNDFGGLMGFKKS
ncbi:hypothetical protein DH2020_024292 [Rehmannia glutinosa]|uniref:Cyclic nucleotide-binding domain-containing protein n=1 Tax=Rehmannia glutinosa TaxID=99300 RepID=A0ABR0WCX3_REHGL